MRISEERLERYRELADGGHFDGASDSRLRDFASRAEREGVDLVGYGFSGLGFFRTPVSQQLENADIACLGIPWDSGSPFRPGSRFGPKVVREWSQTHGIRNSATGVLPLEESSVIDFGDLNLYMLEGQRALSAIAAAVRQFRDAETVPLVCGGEHTSTYGVVSGLVTRDDPIALVHIDAHPDTRPLSGPDGADVNDSNLFTALVVDGLVEPERSIQIGMRGHAGSVGLSEQLGMRVMLIEEFQGIGVAAAVEEIHRIVGEHPCYLTFDTDALDAAYMPATGFPEPFGLTGVEARDLLRGLGGLDLVGADLVEACPAYDSTGASMTLAAALMFEQLCLLHDSRLRRGGDARPTRWTANDA